MKFTLLRTPALVAFAGILGVCVWAFDANNQAETTLRALTRAGYGESANRRAAASHCPFGQTTIAFLAVARFPSRDVVGYACVNHFGKAVIHETAVDVADRLDWD
jgi:hypothetical protein